MQVPVRLQRLRPEAVLPQRMTEGAAGYDLAACLSEPLSLAPGGRVLIPTGWAVAIPFGFEGQVRPRSGLAANHGITVLNAPGTIDSDYRGELSVLLVNFGPSVFEIGHGERIAQLVLAPVASADWMEVAELDPQRRDGGFGSTGR